jgi:hypothetical protein
MIARISIEEGTFGECKRPADRAVSAESAERAYLERQVLPGRYLSGAARSCVVRMACQASPWLPNSAFMNTPLASGAPILEGSLLMACLTKPALAALAPSTTIRDRDGAYGEIFIRRVRSIGIRDRPTSPRSPWQNAYAERLIGSIRRECIDHIVIFGERHLRHVLLSYIDYYNGTRTHLSVNKDAPISRAAEAIGRIISRPILGGLHHQYGRI